MERDKIKVYKEQRVQFEKIPHYAPLSFFHSKKKHATSQKGELFILNIKANYTEPTTLRDQKVLQHDHRTLLFINHFIPFILDFLLHSY